MPDTIFDSFIQLTDAPIDFSSEELEIFQTKFTEILSPVPTKVEEIMKSLQDLDYDLGIQLASLLTAAAEDVALEDTYTANRLVLCRAIQMCILMQKRLELQEPNQSTKEQEEKNG